MSSSQNSLGYGDQSYQVGVPDVKAVDALQFAVVNTTSSTAITAVGNATITVASIAEIVVGMTLYIDSGTKLEAVTVLSITGLTFTAFFTLTHSGTYAVSLSVLRQNVIFGDPNTLGNLAAVVAKGTQGAFAIATQNLRDSGRNPIFLYADAVVIASTTETLVPLQIISGMSASAANFYNVTAGKTLHIQSLVATWISTGTTNTRSTLRTRVTASGAVVAGSQEIMTIPSGFLNNTGTGIGGTAVNESDRANFAFPGGLELPSGAGIAFTRTDTTASQIALSLSVVGFEY